LDDDPLLSSLRRAFDASPDNEALFALLLRSLRERGRCAEARALMRHRSAPVTSDEARLEVARVLLEVGEAEAAIDSAPTSPEGLLLRARALVTLGRTDEARASYEAAVAANPTLEDVALRAAASAAREGKAQPTARGHLRVVSADDTSVHDADRALEPELPKVTFDDIGGLDELKHEIRRRIVLPFQKPSLFDRFKKRAGGGILLYGPPGVGKTLLARATAGECDARFFAVAISDVLDMYIGESERKLQAVFDRASQSTPSVLFFDEIEALAGKRQYARESSAAKVVSQFLSLMDGFASRRAGLLVMGATNVPWAVDPAFRRPGRFDRVVFVPPPDRVARHAILEIHLRDRPVAGGVDTAGLARRTSGFSGADLEHLVEVAADLAIEASLEKGSEVPIDQTLLERALAEVRPTTTEWLTTARNHARYANEGGQYDDVLRFLEKHGRAR
jgi:SpoVK/Ycf46/Vps4 family AAA+-type ATPase